jgi:hypothetical protein
MKVLKLLSRHRFLFYALCFAPPAWSSLHRKAVAESVLYCVALAASLFLAALPLSVWEAKKPGQAVGRKERQEETSP